MMHLHLWIFIVEYFILYFRLKNDDSGEDDNDKEPRVSINSDMININAKPPNPNIQSITICNWTIYAQ